MTKEPTPAQLEARRKFGEAAKARAAAKKEASTNPEPYSEATPTPAPTDNNDISVLLKRIDELERNQFFNARPNPQYQTKAITKFSVETKDYPDPRDRLFKEQRLILKNFTNAWFLLEWKVSRVDYDKDEIHYSEPRFELELWRIKEDEAGEPSNKKFKVATGMFFEDPASFIQVAHLKGLDVPEEMHQDFADEMRYLTVRDWLLECFYPAMPTNLNANKTEETINNRVVEVVEMSSVDGVGSFEKIQAKAV